MAARSQVNDAEFRTSRKLRALLQVSLASTKVLNPLSQARLVLDAIVELVAAERAFIFLGASLGDIERSIRHADELKLFAGRTFDKKDALIDWGYSASILDEAISTRRPVVLGATDSIHDMSESVLAHDLRSLVAAPLILGNNLIGVVYADNRLARGVFSEDDVEVFSAIASHVAIAIETARVAKLESDVEAERAQRLLAEHLSLVAASVGSSLDLRSVLDRILDHLTHLTPYRRAAVILRDEEGSHVAASRGFDPASLARQAASNRQSGGIEARESIDLLSSAEVVMLKSGFPAPFSDVPGGDCLVSVPMTCRGVSLGLLITELTGAEPPSHKVEIIKTFAGHASIAVENARLFEAVQKQATIDALTGLCTRRHFFALATREMALAERTRRVLSVLMIDVDHFKRINDAYGHSVGDEVLAETARRLSESLRPSDIIGRYGGEEFIVLLVDEANNAEARHTGSLVPPPALVANRLCLTLSETPVRTEKGPLAVTASIGWSSDKPRGRELDAMIKAADAALYRAKANGRNRVEGE